VRELADLALDAARAAGASYADVRVGRFRREEVSAREDRVQGIAREESSGVGVRCLVDGAWGFAGSRDARPGEIPRLARAACDIARASGAALSRRVSLAPEPRHLDAWQTPMTKDPFKVPLETKIDLLLAINKEALGVKGASFVTSFLRAVAEETYFASTDGSLLDQQITRLWPGFTVTACDLATGDFATRDSDLPPAQRGYEYVEGAALEAAAAQAAEQAVASLRAAPIEPGVRDLVIAPSNLWLAIHESVGRPTQIDRVLGYEADADGDSFLAIADLGTLRFGSELMNVTADRTMPGGLATACYDDEGVKTRSWPLVTGGLLVGAQTIREQASWIAQAASDGCAYADSWGSPPMQRMPNVSLEPSGAAVGLEELIAGVERGLYLEGVGPWSVDASRSNFLIGSGRARLISKGRLGATVRDAAYRAATLEFWRSLDGVGGDETWGGGGTFHDLKGEPAQDGASSHGSPAARFRGVHVVNTGGGGALPRPPGR
jgi:TldD protein